MSENKIVYITPKAEREAKWIEYKKQSKAKSLKNVLMKSDASIQGFNLGINNGKTAGQTIMHCHIHLIPRRNGDINNPRGGVRAIIPGKAEY
jgi:ATP adenylyltransferase